MSRKPVNLDEESIEEAREVKGGGTRSETIRIALTETVRRRRLREALKHRGRIDLQVDQDELTHLRAES